MRRRRMSVLLSRRCQALTRALVARPADIVRLIHELRLDVTDEFTPVGRIVPGRPGC